MPFFCFLFFLARRCLAISPLLKSSAAGVLHKSYKLVVHHGGHAEQSSFLVRRLHIRIVFKTPLPLFLPPLLVCFHLYMVIMIMINNNDKKENNKNKCFLLGHPFLLEMGHELLFSQISHHRLVPLPVPVFEKLKVAQPFENSGARGPCAGPHDCTSILPELEEVFLCSRSLAILEELFRFGTSRRGVPSHSL